MRFFQQIASDGNCRRRLRRRVILCGTPVVMLWIWRCACPLAVTAANISFTGGCIDSAISALYDGLYDNGTIAEAVGAFGAFFDSNAS